MSLRLVNYPGIVVTHDWFIIIVCHLRYVLLCSLVLSLSVVSRPPHTHLCNIKPWQFSARLVPNQMQCIKMDGCGLGGVCDPHPQAICEGMGKGHYAEEACIGIDGEYLHVN